MYAVGVDINETAMSVDLGIERTVIITLLARIAPPPHLVNMARLAPLAVSSSPHHALRIHTLQTITLSIQLQSHLTSQN